MLKLIKPEGRNFFTKSNYVAESIRTAILVGHIKAGERIKEQELKDLLNVSSSPIREALIHLEAEGLLTRVPHAGARVTEMDVKDAKELYLIQSLLQDSAVQICTPKLLEMDIREAENLNKEMGRILQLEDRVDELRVLNYKFHMVVCGINVYPWLTRVISSLWIRFQRTIWDDPKVAKSIVLQHKKILGAIKKRDGVVAGKLMKKHTEESLRTLLEKTF